MEIYCSCFICVKSKQIILLDLKGCMVSGFSSELQFKSIGLKYGIFKKKKTCLGTRTEQNPYWLETCLFSVLFLKLLEVKLVLMYSWFIAGGKWGGVWGWHCWGGSNRGPASVIRCSLEMAFPASC